MKQNLPSWLRVDCFWHDSSTSRSRVSFCCTKVRGSGSRRELAKVQPRLWDEPLTLKGGAGGKHCNLRRGARRERQVLVAETRGETCQMAFPLSLSCIPAAGRALRAGGLLFLGAISGHVQKPACIGSRGHAWAHMSFTLFTAPLQGQKTPWVSPQLSPSQPGENPCFLPPQSLPLSETCAYPGTCVYVSLGYSLDYLGTKEIFHLLSNTNIHLVKSCLGAKGWTG